MYNSQFIENSAEEKSNNPQVFPCILQKNLHFCTQIRKQSKFQYYEQEKQAFDKHHCVVCQCVNDFFSVILR